VEICTIELGDLLLAVFIQSLKDQINSRCPLSTVVTQCDTAMRARLPATQAVGIRLAISSVSVCLNHESPSLWPLTMLYLLVHKRVPREEPGCWRTRSARAHKRSLPSRHQATRGCRYCCRRVLADLARCRLPNGGGQSKRRPLLILNRRSTRLHMFPGRSDDCLQLLTPRPPA
jgi:hypothetical protein